MSFLGSVTFVAYLLPLIPLEIDEVSAQSPAVASRPTTAGRAHAAPATTAAAAAAAAAAAIAASARHPRRRAGATSLAPTPAASPAAAAAAVLPPEQAGEGRLRSRRALPLG